MKFLKKIKGFLLGILAGVITSLLFSLWRGSKKRETRHEVAAEVYSDTALFEEIREKKGDLKEEIDKKVKEVEVMKKEEIRSEFARRFGLPEGGKG